MATGLALRQSYFTTRGKLVKGLLAGRGPGVRSVSPTATVFEAIQLMEKSRIGALLIVDDAKLVGIFTERDCARAVVLKDLTPRTTPVRDVMTTRVTFVFPTDTIEECMSIMTHKRFRHLPVMDDGRLVGIISIGDVVRAALAEKNSMIEQLENFVATG